MEDRFSGLARPSAAARGDAIEQDAAICFVRPGVLGFGPRCSELADQAKSALAERHARSQRARESRLQKQFPYLDHAGLRVASMVDWACSAGLRAMGVSGEIALNGRWYGVVTRDDAISLIHEVVSELMHQYPNAFPPDKPGLEPTPQARDLFTQRLARHGRDARRLKRMEPDFVPLEDDAASVESGTDHIDTRVVLDDAVAALRPEWREIIRLRFYQQLTLQEIAIETGRTEKKVERALYDRILPRLRREIADTEGLVVC